MTDRIVTLRDNSNNKVYPVGFAPAGAVTTSMYTDASITTPKLADGSVTTSKLANNSVTADKLAPGAITVDDIYPVGSIYMSVNNTNPGTLFGGTWAQIEDKFLLSAGSAHTAGETGGSEAHTHTVQIKRRVAYGISGLESSTVHSFDIIDEDGNSGTYSQGSGTFAAATMSRNNASNSTQMTSTNHDGFGQTVTGSTYSTSTLPPYLTVYMWQRTA